MTEILLVLLTAVASEIRVSAFNARGPFIVAATVLWAGYVLVRWRRDPGDLRRWGFGTENLRPASTAAGGVPVLGSAGLRVRRQRMPTQAWGMAPEGKARSFSFRGVTKREDAARPGRSIDPASAALNAGSSGTYLSGRGEAGLTGANPS